MNKFYDMIACEYDQLVDMDDYNKVFPYGSYDDLSDIVLSYLYDNQHIEPFKVLDIGIGTGKLYEKLLPSKYTLTGVDNSERMLEVAKLKYNKATFINHDITKGLPNQIENEKYDYIVVNYLFMHFDKEFTINLINQLTKYLAPFGKLFVGGLFFLDDHKMQIFKEKNKAFLDNYLQLHSYQSIVEKSQEYYEISFMEISSYTGLLIIEKYLENSLHFEDSLVKYKQNTVKWKSNQTQKQRE